LVSYLVTPLIVLLTNFSTPVQSEAVVNGGPAVFVSPTGPNHIMVQVALVLCLACHENYHTVAY
jgi:hypothetical protein